MRLLGGILQTCRSEDSRCVSLTVGSPLGRGRWVECSRLPGGNFRRRFCCALHRRDTPIPDSRRRTGLGSCCTNSSPCCGSPDPMNTNVSFPLLVSSCEHGSLRASSTSTRTPRRMVPFNRIDRNRRSSRSRPHARTGPTRPATQAGPDEDPSGDRRCEAPLARRS